MHYQIDENIIREAVAVLAAGGLVVYPTETMYGVAADATQPAAVDKLLKFKARPAGKPISVLVTDADAAGALVEVNDTARKLYATFLPGPVTVISQDRGVVDPRLVSETGGLGIRISSHPYAAALAQAYGKPITATSANASGKARPYSIETMAAGLSERQKGLIDLTIDIGPLPRREPSTVIDTMDDVQEVVRGGERLEELMEPLVTNSEEETMGAAHSLLAPLMHVLAEKPIVFALEGEMGAGKTRFAQGIGRYLGVQRVISSPTYSIMKEYEGEKARLAHIDCWRAGSATAEEIGLDAVLKPGTVCVVEWAQPVLPYLRELGDAVVGYRVLIEGSGETTERVIKIGAV